MAYFGDWPTKLEQKLRKLWKQAKRDPDELKSLVEAEPAFKDMDWNVVTQKARRMRLKMKTAKKFWFMRMLPARQKEFLARLSVKGDRWDDFLKDFPECPDRQTAYALAKRKGISVEKRVESTQAAAAQTPEQIAKKLDEELKQRILSGALTDEKVGVKGLLKELREKVADGEPPEFLASQDKFEEKVRQMVWDAKTVAALENAMRCRMPVQKFQQYHSYIPLPMVKSKERELAGVSNIKYPPKFLHGIGRLSDLGEIEVNDDFTLPEASFRKPCDTGITDADWEMSVINGANLGLDYNPLIQENPTRCGLANARRSKNDLVMLVNIIALTFIKAAGKMKIFRSLLSGVHTKLDVLDPVYREKVADILERKAPNELIYETFSEVFLNLMAGLHKIALRPNEKPEFTGPTFVVLGYKETDLIATAAYWEVRILTLWKQMELDVEISFAKSELKRARKEKRSPAEIKALEENFQALVNERARTVISNIRAEDDRRFYRRMLAFVVGKFQEVLPNCKVIGQGTTYVKIGSKIVELFIPDHIRPTDTLLANFTNHYGPQVLHGTFPDAVVICHPYSPNYRMTARQVDADGKCGSRPIFVAPIATDDSYLRDALMHSIRRTDPIAKDVFSWQFAPGVLRVSCINGIVSGHTYPLKALIAVERVMDEAEEKTRKERKQQPLSVTLSLPPVPYLWCMFATDPHWGSRNKDFAWYTGQNRYLGMCEAVIELFRLNGLCEKAKLPVHMFVVLDDIVQAHNFPTQQEPHPHQISYRHIEEIWSIKMEQAKKCKDPAQFLTLLRELHQLSLYQFRVRGITWTAEQLAEAIERHVEPNADFFNAVLMRTLASGMVVKGVSVFDRVEEAAVVSDARDIAPVMYGTGNHLKNTAEGEVVEGAIFAALVRMLLQKYPQWQGKEEELKRLVRAPMYGSKFYAWGTVQSPGGYEWGLKLQSSPPRMAGWGDTLLGAVRVEERRGNYTRFLNGRVTLAAYGDKHFEGAVATDHTFYHMSPAGTHTDNYGEEYGLPPNNTGVSFIGLPANGPESGPILQRSLRYDQLRDIFRSGKYEFDWAKFLPNPL